MTFVPVDYFFALIIVIFALIALKKGFVSELFGKAAWVLGLIMAAFFYKNVAANLSEKINTPAVCNILGFLIIFVLVFLIVKLIEYILSCIFEMAILKSLDRALGLLFGFAEGFAIVCLIIFLISVQPFIETGNLLENSFFAKLMNIVMANPTVKQVSDSAASFAAQAE